MHLLSETLDETARRRFEADWSAGTPGDLANYLPAADHPLYHPTLLELVNIDLELRWRQHARGGPRPPYVEDYVHRFAVLNESNIISSLVRQEATLRQRAGQAPTSREYAERFPRLDTRSLLNGVAEDTPEFQRWPRIPDCEILRELGQGGMGVVYLARQPSLGRLVAVKTLRRLGVKERARFVHEAEAVGRLHHPNIVQIHSIGDDAGLPYFLMEYVEGGTLAERLAAGPMPPAEAAALVITVARAMEYAHQRGIIHRDLKPANILC